MCTVSKATNDVLMTRRDLSISLKRASFFSSKRPRWEFVNFVSGDQFVSLLLMDMIRFDFFKFLAGLFSLLHRMLDFDCRSLLSG